DRVTDFRPVKRVETYSGTFHAEAGNRYVLQIQLVIFMAKGNAVAHFRLCHSAILRAFADTRASDAQTAGLIVTQLDAAGLQVILFSHSGVRRSIRFNSGDETFDRIDFDFFIAVLERFDDTVVDPVGEMFLYILPEK